MDLKLLWIIFSIFFVLGGFLSLNSSLNSNFIKWSNERKGVKTKITDKTLSSSKSLGYFLIVIGIVFAIVAFSL